MSKYTITRACGHSETVNIGGKVSERDRLASYEERKDCDECYKAKQDAARVAAAAAAAEAAKTAGLPALQGSEKQVAWAESIRANLIAGHEDVRARLAAGIAAGKGDDVTVAMLAALDRIVACTSATWYIDHRDDAGKGMMTYLITIARRLPQGADKVAAIALMDAICK